MEVKAEHRYAKISAFKVREVTREIQGLPAEAALEIVRLIPKKAARLIGKVLASAIANAENNNNSENKTLPRRESRDQGGGRRRRPDAQAHAHPRPRIRRPHQQAHRAYQDHFDRSRADAGKSAQAEGGQKRQAQEFDEARRRRRTANVRRPGHHRHRGTEPDRTSSRATKGRQNQ